MNIDEVLSRLQFLKKQHGNVRVLVMGAPIEAIEYREPIQEADEAEYIDIIEGR